MSLVRCIICPLVAYGNAANPGVAVGYFRNYPRPKDLKGFVSCKGQENLGSGQILEKPHGKNATDKIHV